MSPRLSALALVLLSAVPASDRKDLPTPPPAVVVDLYAGRGRLLQGEQVRTLTRFHSRVEVRGPAYVELGPGGELELAWRGRSSLRVHGPAALEWHPPRPAGEGRPATAEVTSLLRFKRLEAEVRRGGQVLHLPQGWTVRLGRAALHAAESATGELTLLHRGGAEAVVSRPGSEDAAPVKLGTGQALRLPPAGS